MDANRLEIERLLNNDDISGYQIEKDTGVSKMTISNLRTGKAEIEKLSFDTAAKLTAYSKSKQSDVLEEAVNAFEGGKRNYENDVETYGGYITIEKRSDAIKELEHDLPEYALLENDDEYEPEELNTSCESLDAVKNNLDWVKSYDTKYVLAICPEGQMEAAYYDLSTSGIQEAMSRESWLTRNAKNDLGTLANSLPETSFLI